MLHNNSQAAILATAYPSTNNSMEVKKTRNTMAALITPGWDIVLHWILSHCGISNNEKADTLANQDILQHQPPIENNTTRRVSKTIMKDEVKRRYKIHGGRRLWSCNRDRRTPASESTQKQVCSLLQASYWIWLLTGSSQPNRRCL